MLFEEYLSRLIQFTEDKALINSRRSEAWSYFCHGASVEFCARFIIQMGPPPESRSREYPNF